MSITFDRDGAVRYARQYALNYNKNYSDYSQAGGDCMNFVSQCLHEGGGMPMNKHGNLWYARSGHTQSWSGVDSFLSWIQISWGRRWFNYQCLSTPNGLLKGDVVCINKKQSGTPGDITRHMEHVVILTEDYDGSGNLIVCGHTENQLDAIRVTDDSKMTYLHLIYNEEIHEEYTDENYISTEDSSTAGASMGLKDTVLKNGSSGSNVRALQTRLNFLGFNCGEVDGIFGSGTETAVKAFQRYFQEGRELLSSQFQVDGKAGEKTKEALRYPKNFFSK